MTAHAGTVIPKAQKRQPPSPDIPSQAPPHPWFCHLPSGGSRVRRATGRRWPGFWKHFRAAQRQGMPRVLFVPHSLGAPAKQPDTLASAGDMGQVARSVLNSFSKAFSPGSRMAPGQFVWSGFARAGALAPCQLRRKARSSRRTCASPTPAQGIHSVQVNHQVLTDGSVPADGHSFMGAQLQTSSQQAAVEQVV